MNNRFNRIIAATLVIAVMSLLLEQQSSVFAAEKSRKIKLTIIVRASHNSALESRLEIDSSEIAQAMKKAKTENAASVIIFKDIYLTMQVDHQDKQFRLEPSGHLWDESMLKEIVLPRKISTKLLTYAEGLRKNHYGAMMSWEKAKQVLPRQSIFAITDLETGLTFRVQRRAGSDHADVQPITKEDTKIMKQIYRGQWSWKRKAILVHSGQIWLAASMNGMPHGGDGIPGNGFSGHFCVHFFQSTTHKSNDPDLAHQLMVHKAAGNLKSFFDAAAPHLIAESFVVAMNQQDLDILRQAAEGIEKEKLASFVTEMNGLTSIKSEKQLDLGGPNHLNDAGLDESLSAEVKLQIAILEKGNSKRKTVYLFIFKRESKTLPWHIDNILTNQAQKIQR